MVETSPTMYNLCFYDVGNIPVHVCYSPAQMFANVDANIINILKTDKVTPNYHQNCMTLKNFTESNLTNYLRIITTSRNGDGLEFISTYESLNKSRPIYALQWHPEKILFEFSVVNKSQHRDKSQENIKHSYNAVLIAQFMANFFVNETRKNDHSFRGKKEEKLFIIIIQNLLGMIDKRVQRIKVNTSVKFMSFILIKSVQIKYQRHYVFGLVLVLVFWKNNTIRHWDITWRISGHQYYLFF